MGRITTSSQPRWAVTAASCCCYSCAVPLVWLSFLRDPLSEAVGTRYTDRLETWDGRGGGLAGWVPVLGADVWVPFPSCFVLSKMGVEKRVFDLGSNQAGLSSAGGLKGHELGMCW